MNWRPKMTKKTVSSRNSRKISASTKIFWNRKDLKLYSNFARSKLVFSSFQVAKRTWRARRKRACQIWRRQGAPKRARRGEQRAKIVGKCFEQRSCSGDRRSWIETSAGWSRHAKAHRKGKKLESHFYEYIYSLLTTKCFQKISTMILTTMMILSILSERTRPRARKSQRLKK